MEDVTGGDLGLGSSPHLDICTGTAVCSRVAGGGSVNTMEDAQGTENQGCIDRTNKTKRNQCFDKVIVYNRHLFWADVIVIIGDTRSDTERH